MVNAPTVFELLRFDVLIRGRAHSCPIIYYLSSTFQFVVEPPSLFRHSISYLLNTICFCADRGPNMYVLLELYQNQVRGLSF